MKFYNNILEIIFAVVLLGTAYAVASDVEVRGNSNMEVKYKNTDLSKWLESAQSKEVLVEVDKCFEDDDAEEHTEKCFGKNLYKSSYQEKVLFAKVQEFSKLQLFILYSSLKLDC